MRLKATSKEPTSLLPEDTNLTLIQVPVQVSEGKTKKDD
jgi:hypothetical protein